MIIDFDDPTIITNDFQTVGSNGLIVGNNDLKSLVRKKSLVQKVSVVMGLWPDRNCWPLIGCLTLQRR